MTIERWLPVPEYETLYDVSDQGRIRSMDRSVKCGARGTRVIPGRILKQQVDRHGYPYVRLVKAGKATRFGVHQLVLLAFVGPRPYGMVSRHRNGVSTDPRLINLQYGTQSENNRDAVLHGTNGNTRKTRCARGHDFSGENVREVETVTGTRRYCRACQRENSLRYRSKRRQVISE